MESLELIKELTLCEGISGHERKIKKIMERELTDFDAKKVDGLGSIHFEYKGTSENPKIMFLAHQDEVGFIVADILTNGFIKMQPIGGWNPQTLTSSPVEIINYKDQKIPGVIGSIPIHFLKDGSQKIDISSLFIDIGAFSNEEVKDKFEIQLGDPIIPITNFHYSPVNRCIFSKAFDDRIGIAAVIELGKRLKKISHPNTIYCSGSVQEEVGTRGAGAIANYTKADVAIILEGAPADDIPGLPDSPQTAVGKGVHVRIYDPTMIARSGLKRFVQKTAEEANIPYQLTVRRRGGTDGLKIHIANAGIPTIVLGIPVRYAHSHNGMICLDDFENLVKLLEKITLKLDSKVLQDM